MYILKKFFQITLVLFMSLTLHIIPWVPSLTIENIVNFGIVGLFIIAGYLVYLIIKKLYHTQKKTNVYKSTTYTLLLLAYIGAFAIFQIGVSLGKSKYIKTYTFGDENFYTYKTTQGGTEVSKKDAFLPIRSLPLATFTHPVIELQKKEEKVYAIAEGISKELYDLSKNVK